MLDPERNAILNNRFAASPGFIFKTARPVSA